MHNYRQKAATLSNLIKTQVALYLLRFMNGEDENPNAKVLEEKSTRLVYIVKSLLVTTASDENTELRISLMRELLEIEAEVNEICYEALFVSYADVHPALLKAMHSHNKSLEE